MKTVNRRFYSIFSETDTEKATTRVAKVYCLPGPALVPLITVERKGMEFSSYNVIPGGRNVQRRTLIDFTSQKTRIFKIRTRSLMYRCFVCCLLFILSSTSGVAQTGAIADNASKLLSHTRQDTARVNLLNAMSELYQPLDFDSSLHYADLALKLANELSFRKGIAHATYRKAYSYWSLGSSELSIEKTLESLQIGEELQDVVRQAECFQLLALNYRDQRLLDQAEMYIGKSEQLARSVRNWELLVKTYNIAGIIAFTKHSSDSARKLYDRARILALKYNTPRFYLANVLSNLGDTYIVKDFEKGFAYFHDALRVARETQNKSAEAGILYDMGSACMLQDKYKEADEYLTASLHVATYLRLKRVMRLGYKALADLRSRERRFDEANDFLNSYLAIHDSLLNTAKTRQIVALEKKHEAQQHEQTIKILEQEKYIQSIWNSVLIIGAILLAVVLIVIYRLQRLRNHKSRELLKAQKALNLKLQETDQFKSRFFANISHEFRTPLTLILGPIEDKLESAQLEEKQDLILMKRNANRLLTLVNQLLDLSKLEAGKMEMHLRSGDLKEFVTMLSASFDSLAERKGIYFSKSIALPQHTYGFDEDKVEKIMSNILSNAFKFTPNGGAVTLSVSENFDSSELMIKLTDTGKGISQEDLAHVFSPFYQSKNTSDDNTGTGLGLALVFELVKVYGGTVDIQSQVNVSTTLSISLPLPAQETTLPKSEPRPLRYSTSEPEEPVAIPLVDETYSDTLLIVDDSADLRLFMANSFKGQFNIILARDGEEALKAANEHIPDLVISDVMMPGVDGIQFTRALKTNERTSHIPVILLTAKNDSNSRMDGLRTGADDYLAKPFSIQELRIRIENLIAIRKKLAARNLESITQAVPVVPVSIPSLDDKFISKLKACIEENLSNTNFGVEMLASEMCLSRAQLFRKVKAMMSISPSELINDIRLQHAARMIESKADTLAQIGYSVGFNEQSYFAKRFRKKFWNVAERLRESMSYKMQPGIVAYARLHLPGLSLRKDRPS